MRPNLLPATAASTTCCSEPSAAGISTPDAEGLARSLKALADPARIRLLSIIAAHAGGEACVCDLIEPLGLSQPTVSHHLKVLTESGFVTRDKRGAWAYYTIRPAAIAHVVGHLQEHLSPAPTADATTRGAAR